MLDMIWIIPATIVTVAIILAYTLGREVEKARAEARARYLSKVTKANA